MAEEIGFKLSVDPGNAGQTVKSFKQELKEAQASVLSISREFGELSPQALQAAKALGQLKEQMNDVNELTAAVTEEKRFLAFANLGSTLAGGFAAAQGAMSLVSGESEELQKAMLKVQSAMALSQGLAQISELGRSLGVAKAAASSFTVVQKANSAVTAAAGTIQKLFTGAVDDTSKGFGRLKGAIIGTGIGALVVALGFVVSNFKEIKQAIFNLIPGLASVEKFIGRIVTAVTDFVGVTSEATRATDALRKGIEGQNDVYGKQLELLTASGGKAEDVRKIKNQMYDDEIKRLQEIDKLKGSTDDDKKKLEDLKFQKVLLNAEAAKQAADEAEDKKKKADAEAKTAAADSKQKAKQRQEQAKKDAADALQADQEAKQKVIDALKEKNAFELNLLKIKGEETVTLRTQQIDAEIELLKSSGGKFAEGITALEYEKATIAAQAKADAEAAQLKIDEEKKEKDAELLKEQQEIRDEIRKEGEATELLRVQEKYAAMREVVKGNEELTTALVAAEAEAQAAVKKKFSDLEVKHKLEQMGQIGSILSGASALFGKNTAVGKGIAVAETTINTVKGATAALSASSGMGPWGVALGIAQAAIVTASGIKSVKEILKTKIPGAADAGGSAPAPFSAGSAATSPAVSSAPTMAGIQSTLLDQTKMITEGKEPLKAYVVESEITQKQERQRAITQTANF